MRSAGLVAAAGALAIHAAFAPFAAAAEPSPLWVFFPDHGSGPSLDSAFAAAETVLSPRALERRAKALRERGGDVAAGRLVDERDLEPNESYVSAVRAAGAEIRTTSRWLNAVSVEADPEAVARIEALPCVAGVREVGVFTTDRAATTSEFSYGPAEHQLEMLGIPEAHAMGYRGEGVLICVLDSGFELGHEAFDQLTVRAARDFIFHDVNVAYDPTQDVPNQATHGTTVLSVLAGYAPGRIIGPAYRADYILAKTERIGSETKVEEDTWCEAIEWAEAMGADIAASSLSYYLWYPRQNRDGRTALVSRFANIALERGLLIVNSMGNTGPGEWTLDPPADSPGVISVGAVDWNGRLADFSSMGPTWDGRVKPDLVAMGSGVALVTARSRDRYGHGSGTSYSSPLIAGCAAIVMSAHPDWGPEAVREALVMSGDRASRPDNRYGWGVPNVRDAILYPAIEGKITDDRTREPIAGARVEWELAGKVDSTFAAPGDSPPRGSAVTDSTGAYVVPNLPPGIFRLRVDAPGYSEAVSEPLEVPPSLGDVNLALRYRGK
jgi:subtilase family protein/carboxypeptidase family protein